MGGLANNMANTVQKVDPVAKAVGITPDPLANFALQSQGKTPGWRMMAKGDPLGNKLGLYGKNAPTPWDPLGRKMGLYGYDINPASQVDWGAYQYTAEQMQDPNFNFQQQQRASAVAASEDSLKKLKGGGKARSGASKMLFGE